MGLDVYLYQFKGLNTDAILKLWEFSEDPWAFEAFKKWNALPPSGKGSFPSEKDKSESHERLVSKARELGLSESIVSETFGGGQISFQSKCHPGWLVGDWYSMDTTRAVVQHFTGKDMHSIFLEAKKGSRLFRPDWSVAKKELNEILLELKKLKPAQLEDFVVGLSESFDHHLDQIGVMIETLDFVLCSKNPEEFLLLWSN